MLIAPMADAPEDQASVELASSRAKAFEALLARQEPQLRNTLVRRIRMGQFAVSAPGCAHMLQPDARDVFVQLEVPSHGAGAVQPSVLLDCRCRGGSRPESIPNP